MEFDQVLALRKSVRSYTDEPVSKEDLAALVKAALASSVGKHNDAVIKQSGKDVIRTLAAAGLFYNIRY